MGIKERREREKQVTRQAILTAALQIAREDGWSALTIRKIGEYIEYSAPMVYEYFSSKEDVLLELVRDGFRRLTQALQRAGMSSKDQQGRVQKIADAYWQFAVENSELYLLMHGLGDVPLDRSVIAEAVRQVYLVAQEALLDWAAFHDVVLPDALGATEVVWSLLHGLVSLTLVNRVEGGERRAKNLMHDALQSQLTGWQTLYGKR